MKERIKNILLIRFLRNVKKRYKDNREFKCDKRMFWKNYSFSKPDTINKISYNLIREAHSVEKGLSCSMIRPFGTKSINNILKLLKEYNALSKNYNFAYCIALNSLEQYKNLYEKMNWVEDVNYLKVKEIVDNATNVPKIDSGSQKISIEEFHKGMNINYYDFLSSRHCVRTFSDKVVTEEVFEEVIKCTALTPSACNRQMIKFYNCVSEKSKELIKKYSQGTACFDMNNIYFCVLTYDMNSFYFVGERNQGYLNTGLYAMNFVNALHNKGIGSCFLQFGSNYETEKILKKELNIPENEKISLIIAYGYYNKESNVPISSRKNAKELYKDV